MKRFWLFALLLLGSFATTISVEAKSLDWSEYPLVAHGLGAIDSDFITNSREAFIENYERGHRIFEVDLTFTTDYELIARHDVTFQTFEKFMSTPIRGKHTPLSIKDLLLLLQQYDDAYLITDTKYTDIPRVRKQFEIIVEDAAEIELGILDRIIPQIYNEEMFDEIESIYHFDNIIYTLYQTNSSNDRVIAFAKEKGIQVVTSTPPRFSEKFASQLYANGILAYVHTFNDKKVMAELIAKGADGFYSDTMTPPEFTIGHKGEVQLTAKTRMFNSPDAKSGLAYSLAPQTVKYSKRIGNWYRIDTWIGSKWIYIDLNDESIVLTSQATLFAKADSNTKPVGSLSPQVVQVEEYGSNGWVKVKTWKGSLWVNIS